jgi:hypothetical protein
MNSGSSTDAETGNNMPHNGSTSASNERFSSPTRVLD